MVIIMRLAPSERSLRISLCAEVVEESQLANSTGGSMIGTSQHSDCCAASKAMRCHRSTCALTRSARGRAMTRCEMSGAIALTPSSVAFSNDPIPSGPL